MLKRAKKILKNIQLDNCNYFFIRGYIRSGTNWLERLLNKHPKIQSTGEYHLYNLCKKFYEAINSPYSMLSHPYVKDISVSYFEDMIKASIKAGIKLSDENKNPVWCGERTPVPVFPALIKRAVNFLIIRDPKDILVSWTYHIIQLNIPDDTTDPHNELFNKFPHLVKIREKYRGNKYYFKENPYEFLKDEGWVKYIINEWTGFLKNDIRILNDIENKPTEPVVYIVRYEDLHKDTEEERNKIYKFLGLKASDAVALDDQTLPGFREEDPAKHNRKGIIGDWKNYFNSEIQGWVGREDKTVMEFLERTGENNVYGKPFWQ